MSNWAGQTNLTYLRKLVLWFHYELGNCMLWYDNFECTPSDKWYSDSNRKMNRQDQHTGPNAKEEQEDRGLYEWDLAYGVRSRNSLPIQATRNIFTAVIFILLWYFTAGPSSVLENKG